MMNIKKLISSVKISLTGDRNDFVDHNMLNRDLKFIKGSFRKQPDKDDAWIQKLSQNSKIILDIGANTGYTSVLVNITGNIKELILVDPNPLALSDAASNLIINNLSINCRFFCAFVSNRVGESIKFYTIGTGEAGSMHKSHAASASLMNKYTFVPTVTIDHICSYYNIVPDFIKIDVEGAEGLALEGAKEIFQKQSTTFIVEMHASKELSMKDNANMVLKCCEDNSYSAWYLKEHKLLENSETIAHRGKCHLLLIPKNSKYPEELRAINENSSIE